MTSVISTLRNDFHRKLLVREILTFSELSKYEGVREVASNADTGQKTSVEIANALLEIISGKVNVAAVRRGQKKKGQSLGNEFEQEVADFIRESFASHFNHLRPGSWSVEHVSSRSAGLIGRYEQYSHLSELSRLAEENAELRNFLGEGYTVAPDIVVLRTPENDSVINAVENLVSEDVAKRTALRALNHPDPSSPSPILHASVSCKFTMRSDRAQNTRTEALNLIRSRKGRVPHILSLTAEPTPSRIASLALGTGDLDCVYHFALDELRLALDGLGKTDLLDLLDMMVEGKRLKDISDLPLDISI